MLSKFCYCPGQDNNFILVRRINRAPDPLNYQEDRNSVQATSRNNNNISSQIQIDTTRPAQGNHLS